MVCIFVDLYESTVGGATAAARDGFGDNIGGCVRRHVYHFCAGVLELAFTSKGNGKHFAFGVGTSHPYGGVFHGDFGANISINPFHGGTFFALGAFGNQVVDVVRPVLDSGVPAPTALFDNDLDDCGM